MKSWTTLAYKELKEQKITAILIWIAILMSTIMTTVIGQSIGILQSMRIGQAAGLNGNRYATFHQLSREQALQLHADDRLYDVGDIVNVGATDLGNSSLRLYLREYHDRALDMYPSVQKLKEGSMPQRPCEIALPQGALQYLAPDAVIGDTIQLALETSLMDGSLPSCSWSASFVLTGILENSYLGYATGTVEGIAGEGTGQALLPEEYLLYETDFKTHSKADFQSIVHELSASLGEDDRYIQYNWILLDALGISYDKKENAENAAGFSYMTAACILVGILILLAAGLVIYNILKISVTRRIKEYGVLRAIGGERGQIYRLILLQLFILCGAGIPAGMLLGMLSSKAALHAASGFFSPQIFMANSVSQMRDAIDVAASPKLPLLFASAAVTLLFSFLAAFPAVRYASRVSPVVAMLGTAGRYDGNLKKRGKKHKKIRNFEAYYARLNLKRGRSRTCITILSLTMSITVFIALQGFTNLLDASQSVQDMYVGDYAITNETTGIPADAVQALSSHPGVETLFTSRLAVFHPGAGDRPPFETDLNVQPYETLQLASLDDTRLLSYASNLSKQDKQALLDGSGCLIQNPIAASYGDTPVQWTSLAPGDTIHINDQPLRVIALSAGPVEIGNDGFANGIQIITNHDIWRSVMGNDNEAEVYPALTQDADVAGFEDWLENWCDSLPGTHWLSYQQSFAEMSESFEQIRMLCWALILFVGMIGVLNIINTVYTNIHTRIAEIGMQRAIGMSAAGLYQTFLWEGAYYGIYASLIGAVSGYICCMFTGAARTDALGLVPVPFVSIAEASVISVAACLLATIIPLRAIAKMNIVESIETVE